METLLERFCRYVRIDTQADEQAATYPSSVGQLELGKMLVQELRQMGLRDAAADEHGIVMATIPPKPPAPFPTREGGEGVRSGPTIAWIAHLDTSPETSGHN